jgi:RhoGEF domain
MSLSSFFSKDPSQRKAHAHCSGRGDTACACEQFVPIVVNDSRGDPEKRLRVTETCLSCRCRQADHALTEDFPLKRPVSGDSFEPCRHALRLFERARYTENLLRWIASDRQDDVKVVQRALLKQRKTAVFGDPVAPWESVVDSIRETDAELLARWSDVDVTSFARAWTNAVLEAGLDGAPSSMIFHQLYLVSNVVSALEEVVRDDGEHRSSRLLDYARELVKEGVEKVILSIFPNLKCVDCIGLCGAMKKSPEAAVCETTAKIALGISDICRAVCSTVDQFLRAEEIRFTEASYVSKLQHLLQCCECAGEPVPHISAMYQTHKMILSRMNDTMGRWRGESTKISEVLTGADLAGLRPFYNDFLLWQQDKLDTQTPWFQASSSAQSLASTMSTRVLRYGLLFEELIKHTPADHADRTALEKVLEDIHTMMRHTNDVALRSVVAIAVQRRSGHADSGQLSIEMIGEVSPVEWGSEAHAEVESSGDAQPDDTGASAGDSSKAAPPPPAYRFVMCLTVDLLCILRAVKTGLGQKPEFEVIVELNLPQGIEDGTRITGGTCFVGVCVCFYRF